MLVGCGGGSGGAVECDDGDTRACYRGPIDTRGVGTCTDGVEVCTNERWTGVCVGDVTPFVERCDGEDGDCDGVVDNVESSGDTCVASDGCSGEKACIGDTLGCVAPDKNECGLCGGPAVADVGMTCSNGACPGVLACTAERDATSCNAPAQNACELCGGPAITGLGTTCSGPGNCAGELVCNAGGNGTTCSCNPVAGQCKDNGTLRPAVAPVLGDLVITEVMPSPSGDDTLQEWFEVEVTRDVDLNQVALDRAGDAAVPIVMQSVNCLRATTGSRLVFARSADPLLNGGLPAVAHTFSFSLVTGSTLAPGDVRLLLDSAVLDAITWTSSATAKSRQLDPDLIDAAANDSPSNFCDATTPYGTSTPQDLGTPGAANLQCALLPPAGSCTVGGVPRPIEKPAAGALVLTEFLANPAGSADSAREWLELTNTSAASFDLNELVIARAGTTGSRVQSAACIPVAPAAFALLARSNDPAQNGALPTVDATFGFALVDSNGDVEVRDGATVLDAITWTSVTSGVSRQLDPDFFTTAGNDSATSFCPGTTPYGDATNLGTPRAANPQCP